jgi:A/G-specific adenine glycosylase
MSSEPKVYNTSDLPSPRPRRIARAVERWFQREQRPLPWRNGYDPYHVWVSEVMLQQTRMEVVLGYFERFIARFPTLHALAAASEEQVLAAWSGLGYYRRARMLREGAIAVVERGSMPETVGELTAIPGIGRYTAGAISSIAFRRPAPIVDGNVARILSRLEAIEAPLGSPALMREAWLHATELVEACGDPRDFNQGLMETGALICKPRNPACGACAVRSFCKAFASGRVNELPRPKAKQQTHDLCIPLYLVTDRDGRVLMRRERGKLMTAMLHLPHGDSSLLSGRPLDVERTRLVGKFRHTVTNRRIQFELFEAELPRMLRDDGDYEWIDIASLSTLPHPSYVTKALALLSSSRA